MVWNLWTDKRPDTAGLYWWRGAKRLYGGMLLRPEWTGLLSLHGMGYGASELWPSCSSWNGRRRTVLEGLEWLPCLEGEKEYRVAWPDFRVLPCPFCGREQTLLSVQGSASGGVVVSLHPHDHNRFWWKCPCGMAATPHSPDLSAMVTAWNRRAEVSRRIEPGDGRRCVHRGIVDAGIELLAASSEAKP